MRDEDDDGGPAAPPPAYASRATRVISTAPARKASFAATFKAMFHEIRPIFENFNRDGLL